MRVLFPICFFLCLGPLCGQTVNSNQKLPEKSNHNSYEINDYSRILSFNICENKFTIDDPSDFFAGDTVLIIEMKGAKIDSSNSSGFGDIINYRNSGNYEFNYIKNISGNTIELKNNLTRKYDIPDGIVQLVRVPYFQSADIYNPLTCPPWNGVTGGVLVLFVQDTLTLYQPVSADAMGFRGGNKPYMVVNAMSCGQTNYFADSSSSQFARKGEGIAGLNYDKWNGRGKMANGGGGGNGHNSGGAGGGNYSTGGSGGYQLDSCGSSPFNNGGKGGTSLNYNNTVNKIFLGGGGGAGHMDSNEPSFKAAGGNGGGIIIIKSGYLRTNNFPFSVNGDWGQYCFACNNNGMGGGGAGGTVLLDVGNYLDSVTINADGGDGSSVINYNNTSERVGPGGGGSGGVVWIAGNVPGGARITKKGGVNGVIYYDSMNPWGSARGNDGSILSNLSLVFDNIPFVPSPVVRATKSNDIDCSNDVSQLHATGALQYFWTPVTGLNDSRSADPKARPNEPTTYTVNGVDGNGCMNTDSVIVKISNLGQSLFLLPSAFTPNKDGLNDCFGIERWGIINELSFNIYNRWGQLIFHSITQGSCWDGKFKGINQPVGTFIYIIRAKTSCGNVFKKGTVSLIR